MNPNLRIVVSLYVFVFLIVVVCMAFLSYLHTTSTNDPSWLEGIIEKLTSIIEIISGAVVGALSTAFAFVFRSKKDSEKEVQNETAS